MAYIYICNNKKGSLDFNTLLNYVSLEIPQTMNINITIFLRSKKSPSRPAAGDITKKGIIDENVVSPTQVEEDDSLNTIQEVAMTKVHIAAPDDIPASHVYLKSEFLRDSNCGKASMFTISDCPN